jgi:hypothetical protein
MESCVSGDDGFDCEQTSMGSMLNPFTALNNITPISMRNPPIRDILSGFEGVVMPGEMLRKSRSSFTWSPVF